MERITFRIPERQLEAIEQRVERGDYPSRSEAIREALRQFTDVDRGTERDPEAVEAIARRRGARESAVEPSGLD